MARHGRDSRQRAADEAVGKVPEEVGGQEAGRDADDEGGILRQTGRSRTADRTRPVFGDASR